MSSPHYHYCSDINSIFHSYRCLVHIPQMQQVLLLPPTQTSALHMDSPAMLAVVTIITLPCIGSERRLSMHPAIPVAPKEAGCPGTASQCIMGDVPCPLTGSHAAAHAVVASPATLPTVFPPISNQSCCLCTPSQYSQDCLQIIVAAPTDSMKPQFTLKVPC